MTDQAASRCPVTRGPGDRRDQGDQGDLSQGDRHRRDEPLGPLVTPRLVFDDAQVEVLEQRWNADDDGRFACPLPGHEGSALLGEPPGDHEHEVRVLCCRGRWRSLGEVRAAQGYGSDRFCSNIELATWTRRLAYELEAFAPADVRLPAALADSPGYVRVARDGFALLVGLRWADGPQRPVAWSVRFAAAWCRLTFRQAALANRLLEDAGVIVEAGRVGRCRLYLPGDVGPVLALVDESTGPDSARAERFARDYPELSS